MDSDTPYHHGDLPTALVTAAIDLLEEEGGADLSLRAVARRAGVSTAAPYRHFADRTALLSAVAAVGYSELARDLAAAASTPESVDDLARIATAYVRFALARPGMFRVMFTEGCDTNSPERVRAVEAIGVYLNSVVASVSPGSPAESTALALWSMVHGLAFLFLDGKIDASSDAVIEATIAGAVRAAFELGRMRAE